MPEFIYRTPLINRIKKFGLKNYFQVGVVGVLLFGTIVTFAIVRHAQDLRQNASGSTSDAFIDREEVVPFSANSSLDGNGWGGNISRIIRTSNGDIYTTLVGNTVIGADVTHRYWFIAKRDSSNNQWQVYKAPGSAGQDIYNAPEILRGPQDQQYVVSWMNLRPYLWTSTLQAEELIPGNWYVNPNIPTGKFESDYPGSSINPAGDIITSQVSPHCSSCSTPNTPGVFNWAIRLSGSNTWAFNTMSQAPVRSAYSFITLNPDRSLSHVGSADAKPEELGYPPVPANIASQCPGCSYLFDGVTFWGSSSPTALPTTLHVAGEDPGNCWQSNTPTRVYGSDAYVDTLGRTHVLYDYHAPGNNCAYSGHHAIIENGVVIKDVDLNTNQTGIPYSNRARIIQDKSGRFFIFSVATPVSGGTTCTMYLQSGTDTDTDGTQLLPRQVLTFKTNEDCSTLQNHFITSPRSGNLREDYVDGILMTNYGNHSFYYRLQLHGAPTPTPQSVVSVIHNIITPPSPTPTIGFVKSGKISFAPTSANLKIGDTVRAYVVLTAGQPFKAASAHITVPPHMSIVKVESPTPEYGPCNFDTYALKPSLSDLSFNAYYSSGRASSSCTLDIVTLRAIGVGTAPLTIDQGTMMSFTTNTDLFASAPTVTYTSVAAFAPTATPTVTPTPRPTVTPTPAPVSQSNQSAEKTGTMLVYPYNGTHSTGENFSVGLYISGNGSSMGHVKASISLSPNLSIEKFYPGNCNMNYSLTPNSSNLSFEGDIPNTYTQNCVAYYVTLQAHSSGNAQMSMSNASMKNPTGSEILKALTDGNFTIQ